MNLTKNLRLFKQVPKSSKRWLKVRREQKRKQLAVRRHVVRIMRMCTNVEICVAINGQDWKHMGMIWNWHILIDVFTKALINEYNFQISYNSWIDYITETK